MTWAHPKYESIIATCGYDRTVKIWKEISQNRWEMLFSHQTEGSVNTIQFCPWEYGLILAAGIADGRVLMI